MSQRAKPADPIALYEFHCTRSGCYRLNAPRGAAKQARPSLLKKASAPFFGVGLSERHPERERQAQARREACPPPRRSPAEP